MKSLLKVLFFGLLTLTAGTLSAQAELSYDRYASILKEKPESSSRFAKLGTDFLTYPLELLRWPANQGMIFFDEKHLLAKGQWLYEKSVDYGVTPRFDGADFDLIRMSRLKSVLPDTIAKSWISFDPHDYFVAGGKVGWERIAQTPLRSAALINYENRPREYFYGIGPDTSRGESTSYRFESTHLEGQIGYSKNPSFGLDAFAAYKNINISNGKDGGSGTIEHIFNNRTIPGVNGDRIFSTGLKAVWDKRNQKENSTKGYLARTGASFNEGLGSSDARYFRFDAEWIHYLRLASDRRIFVTRLYAENNNELKGHYVPFHQMAKLGGFGATVHSSQSLRGFQRNRFFDESMALLNLEYRYTVYEYRDWRMDTILFWDEGQVFDDLGSFQLQDFRESYGIGFRVSLLNNTVLDIELGHGDEGTHFYVKSRSPF